MSSFTTKRSLTYWGFFVLFLLGGGPIFSFDWMATQFLHNTLDGTALLVSVIATFFVFTAYRKTKSTVLAILSVTLAGTVAFEFVHEVADSASFAGLLKSDALYFMPWSWHASRMFLAMGLVAAAVHATKANFGTAGTVGRKGFPSPRIYALFCLILVPVGTIALIQADLPSIYYSSVGLIRLPEVISGAVFLAALLIFVRRGNWRTDSYGHWLNIALVASINTQFFCMAFSQQQFDSSFIAAHILKIVGYGCIAFGFARGHIASSASPEDDALRPKGIGLGIKVAILCGSIGVICVVPIAIKSSATLHEIAAANGMEKLSAAAITTSDALAAQRSRVDADLDYLAGSKVIESLHRAEQQGIDLETGRTREQLIVTLSRLTQNLLNSDAEYLSLAYFDVVSGRPMIRSEQRLGSSAASSNRRALEASERALAQEFLLGSKQQPLLRSGVFTLEDESAGEGGSRRLIVEGTAQTVFSRDTGRVLGVLVLHTDIASALMPVSLPNVETQLYVANSAGVLLAHPPQLKPVSVDAFDMLPEEPVYTLAETFPDLDFSVTSEMGQPSGMLYEQPDGMEIIVGYSRLAAAAGSGDSLLYVYTGSRDEMEQNAAAIGFELQQIAQFNLLVAIVIGWFFAGRFAKPVQQISSAAVAFGRDGTVMEIPEQGRDEIGMLGKSLSDMMVEVANQREKLLLLSSAVESSVDSTIITAIHGDIEYVNPHYLQYAGINAEDVIGKNIMELREFIENRHILSKAPAKKGKEQVWIGELQTRRADGKLHDEIITIAPIRNAADEIINQSLIIEDITERKEMERNIALKAAELQRSNRDLEQFAYVASHDLKAPLRAIEVLVSWLKEDLEEYEGGDVQENLDLLRRRTSRLSRLLDDLLAYSRAGRKIGDVKEVNTKEFVDDIALLISPPEGFRIEVDGSLPTITTYHAPLETVFRNLMSNAIKHSPAPETGCIRVFAEDRGDMVEFAVEDNGTGIDQEYAAKVFKMFQTLQARDEKEGSGMGLAIVQRIIDWQGGKIWFHERAEGSGTVFRFTWNKQPPKMPELPADDGGNAELSNTQILREEAAKAALADQADSGPETDSASQADSADPVTSDAEPELADA